MNDLRELLESVKADLLSRRLAPVLALLCVGLVGALAYVAMGGREEAKPPMPVAAAPLPSGLPVTVAPPNATEASAETPAGSHYQTHDPVRNPFLPLPGAVKASSATPGGNAAGSTSAAGSKAGGSTAGSQNSGGGSSNGSSGGGTQQKTSAPSTKKAAPKQPTDFKPRPDLLFDVSVLFGKTPANPSEQPALTPFEELKLYEPLPSAKTPLLVYIGVTKVGERAAFALIVPPILRGPAVCLPSQSQCQAIALNAGQSEELEYVKTNGETAAFELQVVKVSRRNSASGASAKALEVSQAGRLALSRAGLLALA